MVRLYLNLKEYTPIRKTQGKLIQQHGLTCFGLKMAKLQNTGIMEGDSLSEQVTKSSSDC